MHAQHDELNRAALALGYPSIKRYVTRAKHLFDGVDLDGRSVLDVGCGPGAWTIWSALNGASTVFAIEPESDGSTSGTLASLQQLCSSLGLHGRVVTEATPIAPLYERGSRYDVIVMYNVINHIDESSVALLQHSSTARENYLSELTKIRQLLNPGGRIVVADVSPVNFWRFVKLSPSFIRSIEWHKHQSPKLWTSLLLEAGFLKPRTRWSYAFPLIRSTSNRVAQFFLSSHFVLDAFNAEAECQ
jgi:2-polyprenyl-3-methyl-5-hydroxy-6-metoxy-1,4-benzoquinol methylase